MNAPTTARACPKCKTSVAADTKFCPNCGAAVSGIFSGGGTPLEGTATLAADEVDILGALLQEATLGDYDIYGELGRGGMAAVYLALDLSLNRKVAIKTMLPDLISKTGMVDRFKREAQTAAALSHPHIIQIFGVKQTKSLVYFVMKYIEGRSLESVITERGQLDVDLARVILGQTGGALAFAHRKGVIHRDVKPANIMLEEDGWAIVTDFGIAKVQEAQSLTATGTAIGTPHYMSPEQFHNKAVSGASDQYSLGIVAYEMLTGRKPFDGFTYAEIVTQHLFEPAPDLREVRPDIPKSVAEAVTKMMAKEASDRFPDLDAAIAAMGTPSTTQGEAARTQMISLAKEGGPRKVRMSVPQSPIPAQRRSPAATVTDKSTRQQAEKKRAMPMTVIVALVMLIFGGAGTWVYLASRAPQQQQAQNLPIEPSAGAQTPTLTGAPVGDAKPKTTKVADSKSAQSDGGTKSSTAKTSNAKSQPSSTPAAPETKKADAPPAVAKPTVVEGSVRIGTPTDGAVLYVNGVSVGIVKAMQVYPVKAKADGTVNLQIKADNCKTWDSTFTVTPNGLDTVGRRPLECGK